MVCISIAGNQIKKSYDTSNIKSWFRWNTCLSGNFSRWYENQMAQVRDSKGNSFPRTGSLFFHFRFSVLDEDSVGADFLGEYRLKLSLVRPDLKETYSIFLQPKVEVSDRSIDRTWPFHPTRILWTIDHLHRTTTKHLFSSFVLLGSWGNHCTCIWPLLHLLMSFILLLFFVIVFVSSCHSDQFD